MTRHETGKNSYGTPGEFDLQPVFAESEPDFYAGESECAKCHAVEYASWQSSNHARIQVLLSQPHEGRCENCHHTNQTIPFISCEACHGPSGTHAMHPESTIRPYCGVCEIRKRCIRCHTRATDPGFDFPVDYPRVKHNHP